MYINTSYINKWIGYALLFLLVAESSMPFFFGDFYLYLGAILTFLIFILKDLKVERKLIEIFIAFLILFLLQVLLLRKFNLSVLLGYYFRLLWAYAAVKIIGPDFTRFYVNIIYFLTIIGFFIYFSTILIPGFYEFIRSLSVRYIMPLEMLEGNFRRNIIIYTCEYWLLDTFPRNAGPFWEPGGYGVFLILALLFNTVNQNKMLSKRNIIFSLAIITTFSMGTYFAYIIYLILTVRIYYKRFWPLVTIFILVLAALAYFRFEFLGSKLDSRYEGYEERAPDVERYEDLDGGIDRFSGIELDLKEFLSSPIIGTSKFGEYEFQRATNSVTALLREFGIYGFILIIYLLYKSMKNYVTFYNRNTFFTLVLLSTYLASSLSQAIFGKSFFMSLLFLHFIYNKKNYVLLKNYINKNAKKETFNIHSSHNRR